MLRNAHQDAPLLRVEGVSTHFSIRGGQLGAARRRVTAVDGVSFELQQGRTFGLVGESGCGKSTLARTILRLIPASGGRVWFESCDVFSLKPRVLRDLRRRIQLVFQDPMSSLNPRLPVEQIIGEALMVHRIVATRRERRARVAELLDRVGLRAGDQDRYPHEFSGGQRQRIGIARAIAVEPSLIICDEPVSALDVSIQAQILNLLAELQTSLGLSYLFIAHNLAVVRHVCDEIGVMYLGRIVEQAPAAELFATPSHPYTQALLAAAPDPDVVSDGPRSLPVLGEPPSPIDPPDGCAFHPRCPIAQNECRAHAPLLENRPAIGESHRVACHFAGRASVARP